MYPRIPTPAGRVQGDVLVENTPPAMATSSATNAYRVTELERRSARSAASIARG
jgi:hypothetical protein